jgi:hypothetical protein
VPRNPYITENTEDTEVFLSFLWVFSMFSMLILSVLGVFAGAGVLWAAWALIAFHFSPSVYDRTRERPGNRERLPGHRRKERREEIV